VSQSTLSQLGCGEVGMNGEWEKTCFLEKRNCWRGFSTSSDDPGPCKVLRPELRRRLVVVDASQDDAQYKVQDYLV